MQVIVFFGRFAKAFKRFSMFLKIEVSCFCVVLFFLCILDGLRTHDTTQILFSVFVPVLMSLLAIEAVDWFEYKGTELFNYGDNVDRRNRDQFIGRIFVRALLMLGIIALSIRIIRDLGFDNF